MRHLKVVLTTIGAVTVLALAGNTVALAATGNALVLGKYNSASKITTVKRTSNGPALRVVTNNTGAAPITTNAHGKVRNLNADRLDGRNSTSFASANGLNATNAEVAAVSARTDTLESHAVVAAAYIQGSTTPSITHGFGVDSVAWNSTDLRFEITLTGRSFLYSSWAVSVSHYCAGAVPRVNSVSGKMLITFNKISDGTNTTCGNFSFTAVPLTTP